MDTSESVVENNLELQGIDDLENDEKADVSIKPRPKCPLFSKKSLKAIDDMIVQDMSEVKLYNYVDTVRKKTSAVTEDRSVKRISTKEGSERKSRCVKSEIIVNHKLEETPEGDALGGCLETIPLKDGCESMIHSFCNLDENGFLYKHLKIRDGQYLLLLNGQELSGLTSANHEEVIYMFSTLPVDKENAMIIFDPKTKQTQDIKFVFSGNKEHIFKCIFVPLELVPSQEWRKTEIVAIKLTNKPLFLTCGKDGKLHVTYSTDWKSNHCCHFEHWTKIVLHERPESLSVYKLEKMDVFLGLDGNVVDLVNGKFQHMNVQFHTDVWNSSFIIRPASKRGMALSYDGNSALKVVSENGNLGIYFQKPKVNC